MSYSFSHDGSRARRQGAGTLTSLFGSTSSTYRSSYSVRDEEDEDSDGDSQPVTKRSLPKSATRIKTTKNRLSGSSAVSNEDGSKYPLDASPGDLLTSAKSKSNVSFSDSNQNRTDAKSSSEKKNVDDMSSLPQGGKRRADSGASGASNLSSDSDDSDLYNFDAPAYDRSADSRNSQLTVENMIMKEKEEREKDKTLQRYDTLGIPLVSVENSRVNSGITIDDAMSRQRNDSLLSLNEALKLNNANSQQRISAAALMTQDQSYRSADDFDDSDSMASGMFLDESGSASPRASASPRSLQRQDEGSGSAYSFMQHTAFGNSPRRSKMHTEKTTAHSPGTTDYHMDTSHSFGAVDSNMEILDMSASGSIVDKLDAPQSTSIAHRVGVPLPGLTSSTREPKQVSDSGGAGRLGDTSGSNNDTKPAARRASIEPYNPEALTSSTSPRGSRRSPLPSRNLGSPRGKSPLFHETGSPRSGSPREGSANSSLGVSMSSESEGVHAKTATNTSSGTGKGQTGGTKPSGIQPSHAMQFRSPSTMLLSSSDEDDDGVDATVSTAIPKVSSENTNLDLQETDNEEEYSTGYSTGRSASQRHLDVRSTIEEDPMEAASPIRVQIGKRDTPASNVASKGSGSERSSPFMPSLDIDALSEGNTPPRDGKNRRVDSPKSDLYAISQSSAESLASSVPMTPTEAASAQQSSDSANDKARRVGGVALPGMLNHNDFEDRPSITTKLLDSSPPQTQSNVDVSPVPTSNTRNDGLAKGEILRTSYSSQSLSKSPSLWESARPSRESSSVSLHTSSPKLEEKIEDTIDVTPFEAEDVTPGPTAREAHDNEAPLRRDVPPMASGVPQPAAVEREKSIEILTFRTSEGSAVPEQQTQPTLKEKRMPQQKPPEMMLHQPKSVTSVLDTFETTPVTSPAATLPQSEVVDNAAGAEKYEQKLGQVVPSQKMTRRTLDASPKRETVRPGLQGGLQGGGEAKVTATRASLATEGSRQTTRTSSPMRQQGSSPSRRNAPADPNATTSPTAINRQMRDQLGRRSSEGIPATSPLRSAASISESRAHQQQLPAPPPTKQAASPSKPPKAPSAMRGSDTHLRSQLSASDAQGSVVAESSPQGKYSVMSPRRPASFGISISRASLAASGGSVGSAALPRVGSISSMEKRPTSNRAPPGGPKPLSPFAHATGVIFEGWMDKKSTTTGMWLRRYYVLAEAGDNVCILREYSKTIEAAWGTVPMKMKSAVPIEAIESIVTNTAKSAQGKQFTITCNLHASKRKTFGEKKRMTTRIAGFMGYKAKTHDPGPPTADTSADPAADAVNLESQFAAAESGSSVQGGGAENASVVSDMLGDGPSKTTHLRTTDSQTRLLWVKILTKALAISLENPNPWPESANIHENIE